MVTRPASIQACKRLRENSGRLLASAWSKRVPARLGGSSRRRGASAVSEPSSAIMSGLFAERSPMSASSSLLSFSRASAGRRRGLAAWCACCMAWLFIGALGGCSWLPELKDETAGWSAERLYKEAHDELTSGNYTRAQKLFEQLESRYPYGRLAQQAILENAYANYRAGDAATAAAACDRFIRTYPNH